MKSFIAGARSAVWFFTILLISPFIWTYFSPDAAANFFRELPDPLAFIQRLFDPEEKLTPQADGFGPIYTGPAGITQGFHEGMAIDISAGRGATIYSPISGSTSCWWDGLGNSVLKISGNQYDVLFLHGEYEACDKDVGRGDVLGAEWNYGNTRGSVNGVGPVVQCNNQPGCGYHTHIAVCRWEDGVCVPVDPRTLGLVGEVTAPSTYTSAKSANGEFAADFGLRLSHYDPLKGGANCDSDCTTMASGDKVADWLGGRNGVYAAACAREWGFAHGTKFSVGGYEFECRDTGGYIQCYHEGEVDIAMSKRDEWGNILTPYYAEEDYCWIDAMVNWGVPYGTLTHDWEFIR